MCKYERFFVVFVCAPVQFNRRWHWWRLNYTHTNTHTHDMSERHWHRIHMQSCNYTKMLELKQTQKYCLQANNALCGKQLQAIVSLLLLFSLFPAQSSSLSPSHSHTCTHTHTFYASSMYLRLLYLSIYLHL